MRAGRGYGPYGGSISAGEDWADRPEDGPYSRYMSAQQIRRDVEDAVPYGWNKIAVMAQNGGGSKPPPYGGGGWEARRWGAPLSRLRRQLPPPEGGAFKGSGGD